MNGVTLTGAESLQAQLARAPNVLRTNVRRELRGAAQPIKGDMQKRADKSTRIPPAVKIVAMTGSRVGVIIFVDSRLAPHAHALNNKGFAGTFRHPVFGNLDVWVNQTAMPFFEPALAAGRDGVTAACRKAIDETISAI